MISKSNIYLSHVSTIQLYQRFLLLLYERLVIGMAWSASPSFSDCSDAASNTHTKVTELDLQVVLHSLGNGSSPRAALGMCAENKIKNKKRHCCTLSFSILAAATFSSTPSEVILLAKLYPYRKVTQPWHNQMPSEQRSMNPTQGSANPRGC